MTILILTNHLALHILILNTILKSRCIYFRTVWLFWREYVDLDFLLFFVSSECVDGAVVSHGICSS